MSVSALQPRHENGRFGYKPLDEATFALNDVDEGTFFNPLPMESAAEARAFWRRTEIPDEVLIGFQATHNRLRGAEIDAEYEKRWQKHAPQWAAANPKAKKESDEDYAARQRAERAAFVQRVSGEVNQAIRPELHRFNRRMAVRALAIMKHLPEDQDEATTLAYETQMQLYGYEGTTSVADVVAFFRLDEEPYLDLLAGPDNDLQIQMAVSLDRIDDNMHWMREEQRDIGNAVIENTGTTADNTDPGRFG